MNNHYTYFLILAGSLAGPLVLSFDKKVAFYKKWKYVFTAMLLPAIFYIVWDGYFAGEHIWFFNSTYIIAEPSIYNLPIEEILFFFVVPYCCTFVYECVCTYFPALQTNKKADTILWVIGFAVIMFAFFNLKLRYTAYTGFFLGIFIFIILAFRKYFASFNSAAFLVAYTLILIPYFVVNGLLTAIPVITYNDTENLAIRIYTIPIEDAFYGMLLVMINIVGYEKMLKRTPKH